MSRAALDNKALTKQEKLLNMLAQGMVMIHVDARRPGVSIPPSLAEEAHLRLNLSYLFRPCDLEVGTLGIQVTLTFGGSPWPCRIPWTALFGLTGHISGESLMWLEDAPSDLLLALTDPVVEREPPGQSSPPLRSDREVRRGHLRLVK